MQKKFLKIGKKILTQRTFCLFTIAAFLFFIIPLLYKNDDKAVYVQPYTDQPYPIWLDSDTEEAGESGVISSAVAVWYGKDIIYEIRDK